MSPHALDQAGNRKFSSGDVRHALKGSTAAQLQENGRWSITGGTDLDGIPVRLIVSLYRGFVIITLY